MSAMEFQTQRELTEVTDAIENVKVDLALAHRLAEREGFHEGTWGHFSVVVPEDPERVVLTTPDTHWSRIRSSQLVEVGAEDAENFKAAGGSIWTAYRIHFPVHQARPDAACVLHAHPPYATALATLKDWRLQMVEQNALMFSGLVSYNADYDGAWNDSMEHGEKIAEALGPKSIALVLRNHGVIVTGSTVAEAWLRLYLFERTCRTQALALATGMDFNPVPAEVADDYHEEGGIEHDYFNAMRRLLDEEGSDYAS
jgi:ribulose-5-phosphate 4-epimerase/fuculose-1-phosphate aldolase